MTPQQIIAQSLFDYSGSGQGIDDMLAEIATAQAEAITQALKDAGYIIVRKGAIGEAQREAVRQYREDVREDRKRAHKEIMDDLEKWAANSSRKPSVGELVQDTFHRLCGS